MAGMAEKLLLQLEAAGWQARIVPSSHARDLQAEFEDLYRRGLFDEGFYRRELSHPSIDPEERLPGTQSLIVTAQPAPIMCLTLQHEGRRVPLTLPPTYAYSKSKKALAALMDVVLLPAGFRWAWAGLPVKSLAVHSGLARYGRNNIAYVAGMGSFARLSALYTDLPSLGDTWGELQMMERCHTCDACRRHCPGGAIGEDRFLLHGERCITHVNEHDPQLPFPAWLDPAWHNAVVGCMHCQRVCPENKGQLDKVGIEVDLSEEETALVLRGATVETLPKETVARLALLDLQEILDILPRNAGVLLGR